MTPLEALKAARALIEDPKRWTQHVYAASEDGLSSPINSDAACAFCAFGAIRKVLKTDSDKSDASKALERAGRSLGLRYGWQVADVNDGEERLPSGATGHPAVLTIYDQAIAEQEAKGRS